MTLPNSVTVAALQCAFSDNRTANVDRIEGLIRQAASDGAEVVLPPELFEGPYFPREQREELFGLAHPVEGHPTIERMQSLAKELGIVIPVSFFERAGQVFYNSLAMIDAGGQLLGVYRKSHIPDGPGYQEKFYFRPGDTGFRTWNTRFGPIGTGICWDQWFPEAARAMSLMGADLLLYPTAIGSEPYDESLDTKNMWQRVMIGHAVANMVGVVAANRIGVEGELTFYGSSFAVDWRGDMKAELGRSDEGIAMTEFCRQTMRQERAGFGFFRDRRPDLYPPLLTADGS